MLAEWFRFFHSHFRHKTTFNCEAEGHRVTGRFTKVAYNLGVAFTKREVDGRAALAKIALGGEKCEEKY